MYRITISRTGTLTLYSTGSTDTYGELLSSSGSVLTSDNNSGQSNNFRIARRVTAGTYYLRVRHNNRLTGTGSFTVRSSFSTSTTVAQNDLGTGGDAATLSSVGSGATLISSSVSGSGKIGTLQDTYDMYRFIVSGTNQVAAATIENLGNIGLELKLYNASGTELKSVTANANDRSAKHVFGWQSSGSNYYYLRVRALTSALSLQNYRLQIRTTSVDNMPPVTWGPILGAPVLNTPTTPPLVDNGVNPPPGWAFPPSPPASLDPDIEILASPSPGRILTVTEWEYPEWPESGDWPDLDNDPMTSSAVESYGDGNLGSETEFSASRNGFDFSSTGKAAGTSIEFIKIRYRQVPGRGEGRLILEFPRLADSTRLEITVRDPVTQSGAFYTRWFGRQLLVWVIPVNIRAKGEVNYSLGMSLISSSSSYSVTASIGADLRFQAVCGIAIASNRTGWGEWYLGLDSRTTIVGTRLSASFSSLPWPFGSIIFESIDAKVSCVLKAGELISI